MPVEFLTDEQAAGYAAFRGAPPLADLERFFHLDDADRELVESKRRPHNRLGFAMQLTVLRYLGVFLDDLTAVPAEVVDYLAEQLGIRDTSVMAAYGERENTRLDHARELRSLLDYREFAVAEPDLRKWVDARAWTTGEGPKALFDVSVAWLRERRVLLPGVTTLARLVAEVREQANHRLWATLHDLLTPAQRTLLDGLLTVPHGARVTELDRLRFGPSRVSGPQMKAALERAAEIAGLGMGGVDLIGVPPRRLAELSRYGLEGKASQLRKHSAARRLATLLATTVHLTTRAVDDSLDLLDALFATGLLAKAKRTTAKEKLKTLPRIERAGALLATAVQIILDTTLEQVDTATGEITTKVATLAAMWEEIEAMVSRTELEAAVAAVLELAPPTDSDADEAWRRTLISHFGTVRPFLKLLVKVVDFGATPEGQPVLTALKSLPGLMGRKKVTEPEIDVSLLSGSWRRLVLEAPHLEPGEVDGKAYIFSVLEQAHRLMRRKEIYAKNSSKWGDVRAKLLADEAWDQVKPVVLASLGLPEDAGPHLAARAALLDNTYREVVARLPFNTQFTVDSGGRMHFTPPTPESEPDSLVELRAAVDTMLPRVDLPEVLLEVFSWTGADLAFTTSMAGGETRLKDLNVTIAALLVAHGCNVGYTPVTGGVDALKPGRLSHVDQTYLRLDAYRAANAALIDAQASIPLAQAWGGGMVASVDGMFFVVPVPTVYTRPHPKYYAPGGRRSGATWLNLINDHAAGLGGKVVAGSPRNSLYVLDILYDRDGGRRPEMVVADTASTSDYSDIVFGLLSLAGFTYAPQLADLPDHRLWRIDRTADYGAFNEAANGRIDLERIARHWEDVLRIIGSIHTGAVRAHDVIRMLSRDGRPTPLGDAVAHYGRIAKTVHLLRLADEPPYRSRIATQARLQKGRQALAQKIFHGRAGQLHQQYQSGMEDQIGALGLVLNALVLFNTRYMDAAVTRLRTEGADVREEDVARLSPFVHHHVNMLGRYSFQPPEMPGLRPLGEPGGDRAE